MNVRPGQLFTCRMPDGQLCRSCSAPPGAPPARIIPVAELAAGGNSHSHGPLRPAATARLGADDARDINGDGIPDVWVDGACPARRSSDHTEIHVMINEVPPKPRRSRARRASASHRSCAALVCRGQDRMGADPRQVGRQHVTGRARAGTHDRRLQVGQAQGARRRRS